MGSVVIKGSDMHKVLGSILSTSCMCACVRL